MRQLLYLLVFFSKRTLEYRFFCFKPQIFFFLEYFNRIAVFLILHLQLRLHFLYDFGLTFDLLVHFAFLDEGLVAFVGLVSQQFIQVLDLLRLFVDCFLHHAYFDPQFGVSPLVVFHLVFQGDQSGAQT